MPVTNEDIMRKLEKIESMLSTITKEEEETLSEEKKIEQAEETELKELSESDINLEFANIEDWRKYIWEICMFRVEKSEGNEVDFFCRKQNGPCRFDGCPLNYKLGKK